MKPLVWIASLAFAMSIGASAHASNLITNGDFSTPYYGNSWGFSASGVSGWYDNNDSIEIGNSGVYGLSCVSSKCQNLEVNANTFDTVYQSVSGLITGQTYNLSYLYGGRNGGGPQVLDVSFGGALLGTPDSGSLGSWTSYSFSIVATASTEILQFASEVTSGLPSYGNEIANVSLTATPLPAALPLFVGGLGIMGLVGGRRRKSKKQSALVTA